MAEYGLTVTSTDNKVLYNSSGSVSLLYKVIMPWVWGGGTHPYAKVAPNNTPTGDAEYKQHRSVRIYDEIFKDANVFVITDGPPVDNKKWRVAQDDDGAWYLDLRTSSGLFASTAYSAVRSDGSAYDSLYGMEQGRPYRTAYIMVVN